VYNIILCIKGLSDSILLHSTYLHVVNLGAACMRSRLVSRQRVSTVPICAVLNSTKCMMLYRRILLHWPDKPIQTAKLYPFILSILHNLYNKIVLNDSTRSFFGALVFIRLILHLNSYLLLQ